MKCAFILLHTILTLIFPAHASASEANHLNKFNTANTIHADYKQSLVQEQEPISNACFDNDVLNSDKSYFEDADDDDISNENNNEPSGKKRFNSNILPTANVLLIKTDYNTDRFAITSKYHRLLCSTPVIIFISQFRI